MGMRRLFSLVQWLPYESALGTVLREKRPPDELEPRRESSSGWADLARTLQTRPAMKKKRRVSGGR